MFRCSHLVFYQNGVSNKFTEKQLCRSLFFYLQIQALGTQALRHRYFHANFAQCLITPVAIEHLQWLLRNVQQRCQWDTKKTSLVFSKTIAQAVIFVKISWNLLWFCIPNFSEATYKALLRNCPLVLKCDLDIPWGDSNTNCSRKIPNCWIYANKFDLNKSARFVSQKLLPHKIVFFSVSVPIYLKTGSKILIS